MIGTLYSSSLLFLGGCGAGVVLPFQNHNPPQTTTTTNTSTSNDRLQHVPTQHYSTSNQPIMLLHPINTTVSATRPIGRVAASITFWTAPHSATVMRGRAIARPSCVYFGRCRILHICILRLDRRPQGGGRGAAIIIVDFDGGIDDEVDGVVGKDVALHSSVF